jgi:cytochrome c biogenesis protein CcmG, thiol:disulfide interchange protein DsbE
LVLLKVATKEKEKEIIKYKNDFKITSPILIDEDGAAANAYGIWNRPNTFFINREGKIVARVVKETDWTSKRITNLIQYLVEEKK